MGKSARQKVRALKFNFGIRMTDHFPHLPVPAARGPTNSEMGKGARQKVRALKFNFGIRMTDHFPASPAGKSPGEFQLLNQPAASGGMVMKRASPASTHWAAKCFAPGACAAFAPGRIF